MAKILIVDDALFMRKMLADILIKAGHDIVGEGTNAKEAVELFGSLKPDLITLDIVMPEENGITTLEAVKSIVSSNYAAKILMVSAMGQHTVITDFIRAGASDFIVKPFQDTQVVNAVNKLIKQ